MAPRTTLLIAAVLIVLFTAATTATSSFLSNPSPQTSPNPTTSNPWSLGTGNNIALGDDDGCTQCVAIVGPLLQAFREDPARFEQDLDLICDDTTPKPDERKLCYKIVEALMKLFRRIDIYARGTALDYCATISLCSIYPSPDDQPVQIYTMLGKESNDRWFVWAMNKKFENAVVQISNSTADFATSHPSPFFHQIPAVSASYNVGGFKGYLYNAFRGDLPKGTWFFRVGLEWNWSQVFPMYIHTDDRGTDNAPLRVIAVGDMDVSNIATDSWAFMQDVTATQDNIHLAYLLGDLGYANCIESAWNAWGNMLQKVFTVNGIPIVTIPGNHESLCYTNFQGYSIRYPRSDGGDIETPIIRTFANGVGAGQEKKSSSATTTSSSPPTTFPPTTSTMPPKSQMYYSTTFGPLHILSLNSESIPLMNAWDLPQDELDWAEKDLETALTKSKWIIAGSHRPLYCPSLSESPLLRERLQPILDKYGVDFHLSGHQHTYETYLPPHMERSSRESRATPQSQCRELNFEEKSPHQSILDVDYNENQITICDFSSTPTNNNLTTHVDGPDDGPDHGNTIYIVTGSGGNADMDLGSVGGGIDMMRMPNELPPTGISLFTITTNTVTQEFADTRARKVTDTIVVKK